MRTLLGLGLVAVLLLAGCSDSGNPASDSPDSSSSSSTTTTGPPPKPVVLSDTLHFLTPPEMATALPAVTSEARTPVETGGFGGAGGGGGGQDGPQAEWTYQVTAVSNVTSAEVHVWIEITETLFPSPFANPTQPSCTWYLSLELGGDGGQEFGCLTEPAGPINAGIRELTFPFPGLDAQMEVNETITMRFGRTAFSASANTAVYALSGSADHDSRAILTGFKEPVIA